MPSSDERMGDAVPLSFEDQSMSPPGPAQISAEATTAIGRYEKLLAAAVAGDPAVLTDPVEALMRACSLLDRMIFDATVSGEWARSSWVVERVNEATSVLRMLTSGTVPRNYLCVQCGAEILADLTEMEWDELTAAEEE